MGLVTIKEASSSDLIFVKTTWIQSFLNAGKFCENLSTAIYKKNHGQLIENIFKRGKVLCAYPDGDLNVIAGYLVYEIPNIIHFTYVKLSMRKFGVAKELLAHSALDPNACVYTHRTEDCAWLHGYFHKIELKGGERKRVFQKGKYPGAVYDPYRI